MPSTKGRRRGAAIEAMLRENAEVYSDPENPSGCMVVLGTTTWTPHNEAAMATWQALLTSHR